jgi:HD-GYP domain-containing protein (c-di-GMP phosphodiesterase class II)
MVNKPVAEKSSPLLETKPALSEISYNSAPAKLKGFSLDNVVLGLETVRKSDFLPSKIQKLYEGIIQSTFSMIEVRDPYTAIHQKRVARLALELGKSLRLETSVTLGLYVAAIIYDVGKLGIPSDILCKPGILNKLEFSIIRTHPQVGYDITKWIDFPWSVSQIILEHHERLDGSGYPAGLKADQISIEAKILAVTDVIEAIASDRPYRKALGLDKALEEVVIHKGRFYDAGVVEAALEMFTCRRFNW